MGETLMIGSCEPFSGKSALVLGIARRLKASGKLVRFGKPLATSIEIESELSDRTTNLIDDDVRFVASILDLSEDQLIPSLHLLASATAEQRLEATVLEAGEGFEALRKQIHEPFNGLFVQG